MPPLNPGLLPDHSVTFTGLGFRHDDYHDGTDLVLDYRVDAEDMEAQVDSLSGQLPTGLEWVLEQREEFGLPEDITLEELKRSAESGEEN